MIAVLCQCPVRLVSVCNQDHALQVVGFVAENALVAGGFDGEVYFFERNKVSWHLSRTLQGKQAYHPAFLCTCHAIGCVCAVTCIYWHLQMSRQY